LGQQRGREEGKKEKEKEQLFQQKEQKQRKFFLVSCSCFDKDVFFNSLLSSRFG
jgi:hypothetical protein